MANTTTQRSILRPIASLLAAVLLGLSLSGCTSAAPEDIVKRDEVYKAEFIRRGFIEPTKFGDSSGFLGAYSDWGVGLGGCRLEFRIHDGAISDWEAVSDAKSLFVTERYAHCRV